MYVVNAFRVCAEQGENMARSRASCSIASVVPFIGEHSIYSGGAATHQHRWTPDMGRAIYTTHAHKNIQFKRHAVGLAELATSSFVYYHLFSLYMGLGGFMKYRCTWNLCVPYRCINWSIGNGQICPFGYSWLEQGRAALTRAQHARSNDLWDTRS